MLYFYLSSYTRMASFESTLPPPPSNSDTPFSYPLAQPDSSSTPLPPRTLTQDQQDKLSKLVNHFNDPEFKLPNTLKELKQLWVNQGKESASRFGGLFGGSSKGINVDDVSSLHFTRSPLHSIRSSYSTFAKRRIHLPRHDIITY